MGCNTSKPGKQPGAKPGKASSSPDKQGSPAKRHPQPHSAYKLNYKQLNEAELKKHKIADIVTFVKNGNVSWVHGLVEHFKLGKGILNLRGEAEEIKLTENEKANARDFNPFLLAVAHRKLDVVRYLINDLKISVRMAGKQPEVDGPASAADAGDQQVFCLKIAVANRDQAMFEELWNQYTAWESNHLVRIFEILIIEKWHTALTYLLKSYTTNVVFSSQSLLHQAEILSKFFHYRRQLDKESAKPIDEALTNKPYSLISIYTVLENTQDRVMPVADIKAFIDKALLDVTEFDYGHLKYSTLHSLLRERIAQFESVGDAEKASMQRLAEKLEELEKKIKENKYFASSSDYQNLEKDLVDAFREGDVPKIQTIANLVDLRRIPMTDGENHRSEFYILRQYSYLYWPATLVMINANRVSEEQQIAVFDYLLSDGYGIRQAVRQSDIQNGEPQSLPRQPFVQGPALLLALEKRDYVLFKHLWGDNFVNVWGPKHFQMLIEVASDYGRFNFIKEILNESCGQNLFLTQSEKAKLAFVKDVLQRYDNAGAGEIARDALAQKYYAPYLLLNLIERDQFRKINDYTYFEKCLDLVSQHELEEMSKNSAYEELFMNFLRYTTMLNQDNIQKQKGQKLVDKVFEIEKFKAFKNQSLGILDFESQILDEEGVEEAAQRVHVHAPLPQKVQAKDFDITLLHSYFTNRQEQSIIDYLRAFKVSDLLALRGPSSEYITLQIKTPYGDFSSVTVAKDQLNILQLAVHNGFYNVVNYIFTEHRVIASNRQLTPVDPRIILANAYDENDDTLTLRLAIESYHDTSLFYRLWAYYPHLYTESQLLTLVQYMLYLRKDEFVYYILNSNTTHRIYNNTNEQFRKQFVGLFTAENLYYASRKDDIIQAISQWNPYRQIESDITADRLSHIFALIKDNEIDHLRSVIDQSGTSGIAHLNFNFVEYDEAVLNLAGDSAVTISELNPILLAIKYKSFACLSYLVENFGLRQSFYNREIMVRDNWNVDYPFSSLLIPLLLQTEDVQILEYLLKQEGFVINKTDFNSFVSYCLTHRWLAGLKSFLQSPAAHFFYTTFSVDEQKMLVERVVKYIPDIEDVKLRKAFSTQIAEGIFTQRPYAQELVLVLPEYTTLKDLDFAKLARECLKNLTGEDLFNLYQFYNDQLTEYERKYTNIAGSNFENEMAKLLLRYRNEGKPDIRDEAKKQVRFEERGSAVAFNPDGTEQLRGNRI